MLLAVLMTIAPLALAQEDYDAGKRAYLAGDYAEALRIWQPLGESGNKFAQFSLGSLYFEGAGVEKNYEESAKWFRLAADQGYAPAQFNLGNAYKHGQGVEQDDLKAAEWWRKAAEQEFAPAQFNLGTQYYFGRGVPKDEETAIRWYRRAAENGHVQAQRLFSMTETPANEVAEKPTQTAAASETATAPPATPAAPAAPAAEAASAAAAGSAAEASPAAPASGTARGGESWLLAQNPEDYTLQLLATQDEKLMLAYLDQHQFTEPVAYFAFQRDGKQWYAAVYGAYPGKPQAQNAAATLPPEVSKNEPWIRQFGGIQKLMKTP
jgi:TPR repeat protein